jgi:hypothetical protein
MSRFRLIIMCTLAVAVVSAIELAPAGASSKKCEVASPTNWVFCNGSKEEIGSPVVATSGSGGKATLVGSIGGLEAKFECKSTTMEANLELEGKGKGTLVLHECTELTPEHCKLTAEEANEIKLHFAESLTGELKKPGDPEAIFKGTGSGEEIYELVIEHATSECQIPAGGYKITGKQYTELPSAETLSTEHEIVAKKSLSEFKIGGNEASLSMTSKVKLSSGGEWYMGLGT